MRSYPFPVYVDTPCRVGPLADFAMQDTNLFNVQDLQTSTPPRRSAAGRVSMPASIDADMSWSPVKADNSWADLGFDDFVDKMRTAREEVVMRMAMEYAAEEDEVEEMVMRSERETEVEVEDLSDVEVDEADLSKENYYSFEDATDGSLDLVAEISGMLGDVMSLRKSRELHATGFYEVIHDVLGGSLSEGHENSADGGQDEEEELDALREAEEQSRLTTVEEESEEMMVDEDEGRAVNEMPRSMMGESFAKVVLGLGNEMPETVVKRSGAWWSETEVKGAWWQEDYGFEN
ncbi:hypothetical protein NEOLEDRAFT_706404 [Neolentinus lepideus HHB14362 ss-1]|uniref:Uncharacterized protein n=1 Tax=Neolentinus lepideus HHB14362 ss-1 TaxID=1314782 RepID=A0A165V694_9AGAM|nr:hypothetical protein NEOLEDRAFT_706404 [Neolentinus lepideus HHB14362 ss-1]